MMLNVFVHDVQAAIARRIQQKEGDPTVLAANLAALVEQYPGIRLFIGDAAFSGRNLCEAIRHLKKHDMVRIKGNAKDVEETLSHWFAGLANKADTVARAEKTESCTIDVCFILKQNNTLRKKLGRYDDVQPSELL